MHAKMPLGYFIGFPLEIIIIKTGITSALIKPFNLVLKAIGPLSHG